MNNIEALDIEQAIDGMLHARTSRQADAIAAEVLAVVDVEGHALKQLPLLEANPAQTAIAEIDELFVIDAARVIHGRVGYQQHAELITRNESRTSIDAHYRRVVSPTAQPVATVQSRLKSQLELPCTIAIANDRVHITEPVYRRGTWHDVLSPRSEVLFHAFITTLIWAAGETQMRTGPGEAAAHHEHASMLALAHRRQARA